MKKIYLVFTILIAILLFFLIGQKGSYAANPGVLIVRTILQDDRFDLSEFNYLLEIELEDELGEPVNDTITYSGTTSGDAVFNNGKATLNITNTDNTVVLNSYEGYSYKVNVKDVGDYGTLDIKSATNTESQLAIGTNNVTINMGIQTTSLELKMNVSGDPDNLEFPFEFALYGYGLVPDSELTYRGAKSGVIEKNSADRFVLKTSLKNGESIIIDGLPKTNMVWANSFDDAEFYEMYGFNADDYFKKYGFGTSGSTVDTGDNSAVKDNVLTFNIYRDYENVYLEKRCAEGAEEGKEFTIKVKGWIPSLVNDTKTPIVGEYPCVIRQIVTEPDPEDPSRTITTRVEVSRDNLVFDENGIAYIKLKQNQIAYIGGVALIVDGEGNTVSENWMTYSRIRPTRIYDNIAFLFGAEFEIEETDEENYDVDITNNMYQGDTGQHIIYSTLTNSRKFTGKITINNTVEGENADLEKEFKFKIKIEDASNDLPKYYGYIGSKEGTLEFDDNYEAEITLKHGESITVEGLPIGAEYTISEYDYQAEGYTTTFENENGKITEEGSLTEFVNIIEIQEEDPEQEEQQEEDPAEVEEIEEEPTVEEIKKQDDVEQVQTGDVIHIAFTVLGCAIIIFSVTVAMKKYI